MCLIKTLSLPPSCPCLSLSRSHLPSLPPSLLSQLGYLSESEIKDLEKAVRAEVTALMSYHIIS
jgi:hypothetical protein